MSEQLDTTAQDQFEIPLRSLLKMALCKQNDMHYAVTNLDTKFVCHIIDEAETQDDVYALLTQEDWRGHTPIDIAMAHMASWSPVTKIAAKTMTSILIDEIKKTDPDHAKELSQPRAQFRYK